MINNKRKKNNNNKSTSNYNNILVQQQQQVHTMIDNWAQCENCKKWRRLPYNIDTNLLPDTWTCQLNIWDPNYNMCHIPEEIVTGQINDTITQDILSNTTNLIITHNTRHSNSNRSRNNINSTPEIQSTSTRRSTSLRHSDNTTPDVQSTSYTTRRSTRGLVDSTTPDVQSVSSSTRRGASPPEVSPAVSSSNYSSLKSRATPGDRGGEGSDEGSDGSSIMGMMEDGSKDMFDVTSSGLPAADLREAEGQLNRRADGRIKRGRMKTSTRPQIEPESDLRELEGEVNGEADGRTSSGEAPCNGKDGPQVDADVRTTSGGEITYNTRSICIDEDNMMNNSGLLTRRRSILNRKKSIDIDGISRKSMLDEVSTSNIIEGVNNKRIRIKKMLDDDMLDPLLYNNVRVYKKNKKSKNIYKDKYIKKNKLDDYNIIKDKSIDYNYDDYNNNIIKKDKKSIDYIQQKSIDIEDDNELYKLLITNIPKNINHPLNDRLTLYSINLNSLLATELPHSTLFLDNKNITFNNNNNNIINNLNLIKDDFKDQDCNISIGLAYKTKFNSIPDPETSTIDSIDDNYNLDNNNNRNQLLDLFPHLNSQIPNLYNISNPLEVTSTPPEVASTVGLADSSSNYSSLKSKATPGDRGGEEGSEYKTSSGKPVADLREAEGEVNEGAVCKTKRGGKINSTGPRVEPESDLRELEVEVDREAPCNGKDGLQVDADGRTTSSGKTSSGEMDISMSLLSSYIPMYEEEMGVTVGMMDMNKESSTLSMNTYGYNSSIDMSLCNSKTSIMDNNNIGTFGTIINQDEVLNALYSFAKQHDQHQQRHINYCENYKLLNNNIQNILQLKQGYIKKDQLYLPLEITSTPSTMYKNNNNKDDINDYVIGSSIHLNRIKEELMREGIKRTYFKRIKSAHPDIDYPSPNLNKLSKRIKSMNYDNKIESDNDNYQYTSDDNLQYIDDIIRKSKSSIYDYPSSLFQPIPINILTNSNHNNHIYQNFYDLKIIQMLSLPINLNQNTIKHNKLNLNLLSLPIPDGI